MYASFFLTVSCPSLTDCVRFKAVASVRVAVLYLGLSDAVTCFALECVVVAVFRCALPFGCGLMWFDLMFVVALGFGFRCTPLV